MLKQVNLDILVGRVVEVYKHRYQIVGYGIECDEYDDIILFLMKEDDPNNFIKRSIDAVRFI